MSKTPPTPAKAKLTRNTDPTTKAKVFKEEDVQRERSFHKVTAITTDVFRLDTAVVIKHDSGGTKEAHPDTHGNEFTDWPHAHPFRTFDKYGKRMTMSVPIGGHFHLVEWQEGKKEGDAPRILSVSPPMVMGTRRVGGRKQSVPVPANDYDFHTHDIIYIKSDKIVIGKANAEAAMVQAQVEGLTSVPTGVVSN